MNPNKLGNVVIAIDEGLSNSQKLNALSVEPSSAQDPYKQLLSIVRNARKMAKDSAYDGTDYAEENDGTRSQPTYYQVPPIKVVRTLKGDLMLDLFAYSPVNWRWGRSINASWRLRSGDHSELVLQEYVSDKSLEPGIASYRKDAPRVLDLIEDSVRAYKSARPGQQTRPEV